MAKTYRLSLTCADRSGLVAAVTGRLFDLGGNLGDTTFAVYGSAAEFTTLVSVPDTVTPTVIEEELAALPEAPDAEIVIEPFDRPTAHGPMGRASHVITVSGGDQPGLIARISEVFGEFDANIVHLEAELDPGPEPGGHYSTRFSVALAPATANKCLATVANTAENMNLSCHWEVVP